jgi:simple sugar transport system ATP-binding protein
VFEKMLQKDFKARRTGVTGDISRRSGMELSTLAAIVEFTDISKHFGAVRANEQLSLKVRQGTIHGILGENGAGKSTAMKMLYGLFRPDSGEIKVDGSVRKFRSPLDAMKIGIGMVHQHFLLAKSLTALDNIILGNEPFHKWPLPRFALSIDRTKARRDIETLMSAYGLSVPLDHPTIDLSVGEQQRIEILRLLYRKARILILDEPTAVLTPPEVDLFFKQLRKLASEGRTILIVTHKLRELMAITDEITIMRQGHSIATVTTSQTNKNELASLMVGRRVEMVHNDLTDQHGKKPLLTLNNLKLAPSFRNAGHASRLNLEVFPGEILGIAGVEGNGQSELVNAILHPLDYKGASHEKHMITFDGRNISRWHTRAVLDAGISAIAGDRHHQGLLLANDVTRNLALRWQRMAHFRWGPFLKWGRLQKAAEELLREWNVTPLNHELNLSSFSGGNQQKILVGREWATDPKLLIAVHPTRGVDIGAIQLIHSRLLELRKKGVTILLISSELDEIRALSDRIAVLENYRIVRSAEASAWDEMSLGLAMSGSEQGVEHAAL